MAVSTHRWLAGNILVTYARTSRSYEIAGLRAKIILAEIKIWPLPSHIDQVTRVSNQVRITTENMRLPPETALTRTAVAIWSNNPDWICTNAW
jgi:hypothetical protein